VRIISLLAVTGAALPDISAVVALFLLVVGTLSC